MALISYLAVGLGILVILLGLALTVRALQGARRNDSRPMLYLAIGMALITLVPTVMEMVVIPFVARAVRASAPAIEQAIVASRASEATGIAVILYSLSVRS